MKPVQGMVVFLMCWALVGSLTGCKGKSGSRMTPLVGAERAGSMVPITKEANRDMDPTWDTDGHSVVFASDRFGRGSLCRTPMSGVPLTQVTTPSLIEYHFAPDVNPKDGEVIFATAPLRGVPQVFAVIPGKQGVTQLTTMSGGAAWPSWSPDGITIAFCSPDKSGEMAIWTTSRGGTNLKRISDGVFPRWSPDGGQIVFAKQSTGSGRKGSGRNWDIYVMNADGTGVTQITTEESSEFEPDWSPDGVHIAYVSVNSRVAAPRTWSGWFGEMSKRRNYEIWVSDISDVTRGAVQLTYSSGIDVHPRWSPDGKRILFASDREGSLHVWCMTPSLAPTPPPPAAETK